jgi:hypothetical protein
MKPPSGLSTNLTRGWDNRLRIARERPYGNSKATWRYLRPRKPGAHWRCFHLRGIASLLGCRSF